MWIAFKTRKPVTAAVCEAAFNVFDRSYYRWEKLQYVTPFEGAARGGVIGDGIRRYLEPGRHAKLSVTLSF